MSGQHHTYQSHSWLFSYPRMELNCVIALVSRCSLATQCPREQRGILWIWHLQKPHSCKIFFCQCVRLLWWWEAGSSKFEHVQWWCNQTCKRCDDIRCVSTKTWLVTWLVGIFDFLLERILRNFWFFRLLLQETWLTRSFIDLVAE